MSRLCRYAGGLACLVTVLALVGCGGGPGSTKQADPVGFKDIPELKQGSTSEISLVNTFSGSELTYSAESNNVRVATVAVDNDKDTLTVTAVGPGTATITVTATDLQKRSDQQTFMVTVPEPPIEPGEPDEPGPVVVVAPTVKADAPISVEFDQGQTTRTVILSSVFEGEKLEFSVSSRAPAVATASISGTTLTITAVGPGSATITVTATNAGGSVEHEIAVTVPDPVTTTPEPTTPTTPTSATLTIKLGESAKRTLSSGQTLQAPSGGGVKVERSPDGETDNVWLITAKKKGTHKVTILSAGKPVSAITVQVPNSRPLRQDQKDGTDLNNPRITLTAPEGTTTATDVLLDDYFTDADEEDTLYYRIEDKPSWFLIETRTENDFLHDANADDGYQLKYEVLQEVKMRVDDVPYEFTVTLYASDGEEESTRPVVIEFNVDSNLDPEGQRYNVSQAPVTGDFTNADKVNPPKNRLDVGPRRGVTHTVTFTGATGFVFANEAAKKLVNDGLLGGSGAIFTVTPSNIFYQAAGASSPTPVGSTDVALLTDTDGDENDNFFIIKSTSDVIVGPGTEADETFTIDATSRVPFKLKEQGSSGGGITIEYYVWILSKKDDPTDDVDRLAIPTTKKRYQSKTLSIKVVTCSSPPDPIAACP